MLTVKTLQETNRLLLEIFGSYRTCNETVPIFLSLGRILAEPIVADEFIPTFNRSTVDGFAVKAVDIQGSSDSIPAILTKTGEVLMGQTTHLIVNSDECVSVPTGGEIPQGADTMVMLEYAEEIGNQQIAFFKPSAPGSNMILRGEDGKPGDVIVPSGKFLTAADLGTLSAAGLTQVVVAKKLEVGIISTGDELVPAGEVLQAGQIRDVNQTLLRALVENAGGHATFYGIIKDDVEILGSLLKEAVAKSDLVLVSGGTSVGEKDAMAQVLQSLGQVLVHGIAVKPGKPTILGDVDGKLVCGLPGNPVACFFVFEAIVKPILLRMMGADNTEYTVRAKLSRALSSNHGREEFALVQLSEGLADPIPSKSGLISTISKANAYLIIPREAEGIPAGAEVFVYLI